MLFHITSLRQTDSGMFSARVGRDADRVLTESDF
jgi:hypothetical protein